MNKCIKKLTSPLKGEICIPADKSISHRAAIMLALSKGSSVIRNFSQALDPKSTLNVLSNLGVEFNYINDSDINITAPKNFTNPQNALYCGNSGTTMRLMAGILAAQHFSSILTGDESLSNRPMKRIIDPLTKFGAIITGASSKPPLMITGKYLSATDYFSPISSAQVKSACLLAALQANGTSAFSEPFLSRNHTEIMLKYLGADISIDSAHNTVYITNSELQPKDITVPGDISTAAFFIAAALLVPGSSITIKNVGLNPTRTGFLDVCKSMGAEIEIVNISELCGEIIGDIRVNYSDLKPFIIGGDFIPRLIDEIPLLALLATQADGESHITGAQDLRNKESDRITSTTNALKSLGANIEEFSDGFRIVGKTPLKGGCKVETQNDHRLVMSTFVAGLITKEPISISGFEWINISAPEFEKLFAQIIKC